MKTRKTAMHPSARRAIRDYGAEAEANDAPFSDYHEDICLLFGRRTWAELPKAYRADALHEFRVGRHAEAVTSAYKPETE